MENFTYVLNELSHTGKSVLDIAWYKFLFCIKNLGKCKNWVYMDFFLFIYLLQEGAAPKWPAKYLILKNEENSRNGDLFFLCFVLLCLF